MASRKRKRNDDGSYSAGAKRYRRGSYPYAVAAKYRKRAVAAAGARGSAGSKAYWGDDWAAADEAQRRRRALMHYRGDGDYRSALKWGSRGLGAAAGGLLGGFGTKSLGGAMKGGQMGYDAGAGFSRYMGWGAYDGADGVGQNQLISYDPSQKKISVNHDHNSGDIIFQHTEFIQNLVVNVGANGVSDFEIQGLPLNPGLEGTFPFLAQIAANFTMYEFAGLMFQYKPTFGSGAGDTNALGKVIMATDYDPSAQLFTNSQAMENYDYAQSARPSAGMHHGVETALSQRLTNQLYVRTQHSEPGPAPTGQKDKVLTDLGMFQIATDGIAGPASSQLIVGEIWVTYKVKLSRANLSVNQQLTLANFDRFRFAFDAGLTINDGMAAGALTTTPMSSLGSTLARFGPSAGMLPPATPDTKDAYHVSGYGPTSYLRIQWPKSVQAGTYRVDITMNMLLGLDAIVAAQMRQGTIIPNQWVAGYTAPLTDITISANCIYAPDGTTVVASSTGAAFTNYLPTARENNTDSNRVTKYSIYVQVLAQSSDQGLLQITFESGSTLGASGSCLLEVTQVADGYDDIEWAAV